MVELIWLNGEIVPLAGASVSVEDRGFQFADGVYEVVRLYGGKPFTLDEHLDRLDRSAGGISLDVPLSRQTLRTEILRLVAQSGVADGMVYLQLTRGAAPRNHLFPKAAASTLLFYARALEPLPPAGRAPAVRLISYPDDRWRRCWIKSVALLPNVLAKNAALAAGADEAAFVDNAVVSECSASNLLAVIGGRLVTHPVGPKVLPGVTRAVLLEIAREQGVRVEERPLLVEEAKNADELFITSTTRELSPVSHWDGQSVRGHAAGEITTRLHAALKERVRQQTGR